MQPVPVNVVERLANLWRVRCRAIQTPAIGVLEQFAQAIFGRLKPLVDRLRVKVKQHVTLTNVRAIRNRQPINGRRDAGVHFN